MFNALISRFTSDTSFPPSKTVCSLSQASQKAFIALLTLLSFLTTLSWQSVVAQEAPIVNPISKKFVCDHPDTVALYKAVDELNTRVSIGLNYYELKHYYTELEILKRKASTEGGCISVMIDLRALVNKYETAWLLLSGTTGFFSLSSGLVMNLPAELRNQLPVNTTYGQSYVSADDLARAYLTDVDRVFNDIPTHTEMLLR